MVDETVDDVRVNLRVNLRVAEYVRRRSAGSRGGAIGRALPVAGTVALTVEPLLNRLAVHNPVEIAERRVRRKQAPAICEEISTPAAPVIWAARAARVATTAATATTAAVCFETNSRPEVRMPRWIEWVNHVNFLGHFSVRVLPSG